MTQKARRVGPEKVESNQDAASASNARSTDMPAAQVDVPRRPSGDVQILSLQDMEARAAPDGTVRAAALLESFPSTFSDILYGLLADLLRPAL